MKRSVIRRRGFSRACAAALAAALLLALAACGAPAASSSQAPSSSAPAPSSESASESRSSAPSSSSRSPASSSSAPSSSPSSSSAPSSSSGPGSAAEALLEKMTDEEKVGQLFLVRPDALDPDLTPAEINDASGSGVTALSGRMKETLAAIPVGGVAVFGKNIVSPSQLTGFLGDLQSASAVPLLTGVDEEGGKVSRIANSAGFDVKKYDSMESVGATGDSGNAREAGAVIGAYLKKYGFCLDFAPVADVNTNPDNIVIGSRSFGSDPALAAKMVAAEIEGFHESGVMTSAKHFPGHGDTAGDTHDGFVSVSKTWDELCACELIPFEAAIGAGTDSIMVSHISAPNVTRDGLPSSLSKEMITDRLRGDLGYGGVVITDSLSMGAVTSAYGAAECAVLAVQAGADLLLMPEDLAQAYAGVLAAVKNGAVSRARLDESVLRILRLKEAYGLLG